MAEYRLRPGDQLPHFIMNDENHQPVNIASLKGKFLILYFYPKIDQKTQRKIEIKKTDQKITKIIETTQISELFVNLFIEYI